jgi:transcriptional regulator GlxA family with amidase domain
MKIAFVIYNGITLLDFAGVFDPVTRLKTMGFIDNLQWDVCAPTEKVRSSEGAVLLPDRVKNDLTGYDYLIVPGGDGIMDLMQDKEFLRWISVLPQTTVVVSVCGGSLLLGAAGMLRTKRATTHPNLTGYLRHFAGGVSPVRIVDEGTIITAGGVTAAIDLGLYLCEKIAGRNAREKIQSQMDYRNYCTT